MSSFRTVIMKRIKRFAHSDKILFLPASCSFIFSYDNCEDDSKLEGVKALVEHPIQMKSPCRYFLLSIISHFELNILLYYMDYRILI